MKIIGIPFYGGGLGHTVGTELAPNQIINELKKEFPKIETKILDIDNLNIESANNTIFNDSDAEIIIGGDHSITYSSFKNFAQKNNQAGIIIFDAHPDTENNFSPPSHEDYLKVLIEENFIKPENVLLIGIRAPSPEEIDYLKIKNITYITNDQIKLNIYDAIEIIENKISELNSIYLSVDIDILDPVIAPGTGYLEENGLTNEEFNQLYNPILDSNKISKLDLVEINPVKDIDYKTVKIGIEILKKYITKNEA